MSFPERGIVPPCENRWAERDYDDETAKHLVHPNGTLIASFCPHFLGAALRATYAAWSDAADGAPTFAERASA